MNCPKCSVIYKQGDIWIEWCIEKALMCIACLNRKAKQEEIQEQKRKYRVRVTIEYDDVIEAEDEDEAHDIAVERAIENGDLDVDVRLLEKSKKEEREAYQYIN